MGKLTALLAFPLIAAVILGGVADSRPAEDVTFPHMNDIDAYVEAQLEALGVPGASVAVVRGDGIVVARGYGKADPSGRAVTADTPFILGSTTKSFTALAVMQLVEVGAIGLDAKVRDVLPWFRTAEPDVSDTITIRHLLNHTSGLGEAAGRSYLADRDTSATAIEDVVRGLARARLAGSPGERFEYSNANYSVLGMIVRAVSGQSYEAYVEDHIFRPLGMRHSFTSLPAAEHGGLAVGYRLWYGHPVPARNMPFVRAAAPAGYLICSAGDVAKYMLVHLNEGRYGREALISPDGLRALHRGAARISDRWSYAMGWVVGEEMGREILWHNGAVPNFYSYVVIEPETGMGMAFLMNAVHLLAAEEFDASARGLWRVLHGRTPEPAGKNPEAAMVKSVTVAGFCLLVAQLLWFAAIIAARRGRIASLEKPLPRGARVRWIGRPVLLNGAYALTVVIALRLMTGVPVAVAMLYVHDLMLPFVASASLAAFWGILQAFLRVRAARMAM